MNQKRTKSAGGVVLNKKGEVLVVDQNGNSWSLPKGHIEKGETSLQTARREIYEESGVDELVLIKPLLTYSRFKIGLNKEDDESEIKEIEMFLFQTDFEGELSPKDLHNKEARWVKKEDVENLLTHQKDKEFFRGVLLEI